MTLKKTSTIHSVRHSMEKQWKMFVIEQKYKIGKKMILKKLLNNNQN